MWVRMTHIKMDPGRVEEARALYNSDDVSGVVRSSEGYAFHHLLESVDNPGEVISITAWDTQEHGETYEHSGTYMRLVAKFNEFFTSPPVLKSYVEN